jgi:L-lactate dehydrogenase
MRNGKVALIGTGYVGMSFAYASLNQAAFESLVLIDLNKDKAIGEALDLNHGIAFAPGNMEIKAGDYSDCHDAEVVVITAGVSQAPGETRQDLLLRNAKVMRAITKEVVKSGFNGIFLIATNPVDVLSHVVWLESGFDHRKVIGSGTTLDSARLRYEVGRYLNLDPRNVHAYIMGEHGDSEFVCWSLANVATKPIYDVIKDQKLSFDDLDKIYHDVKNAAYEIIKRKDATYYGIGMSLVRIVKAIISNENSILPVSTHIDGEYVGVNDIFIGVPSLINKFGVERVMKLDLSKDELKSLQSSAKILRDNLDLVL